MKNQLLLIVYIVYSLILTSCGSGGSGDSTTVSMPAPQTSVFVDSPVKGLHYVATPSNRTGITDSNGAFSYSSGDSVTFYIGGLTGIRIGSIKPVDGSNLFVSNLPNYDSVSLILNSLDTSKSSSFIDLSDLTNVSTSKTSVETFLSNNQIDSTSLTSFRTIVKSSNPGLIYKNSNPFTLTELYQHLKNSQATLIKPSKNPIREISNKSYFSFEITDTGLYTGEKLSNFYYYKDKNNFWGYTSDYGYRKIENASNPSFPDIVTSIFNTLKVTDTYFNSQPITISCPVRNTYLSITDAAFIEEIEQNYTNSPTAQCEKKALTAYRYALDLNFSKSTVAGRVLTLAQACGGKINTFTLSFSSNGDYSFSGKVCSIKQQNPLAVNARGIADVTLINGETLNVSDFPGLVRLTPSGYSGAIGQKVMLMGRSVDGARYYFSVSDGGSPGQLAGGLLNFVSLN